jgi:hypothetical protein
VRQFHDAAQQDQAVRQIQGSLPTNLAASSGVCPLVIKSTASGTQKRKAMTHTVG